MSVTNKFVDYLFELSGSTFSPDKMHEAKRCLLDYLGVTLVGTQLLGDKLKNLVENPVPDSTLHPVGVDVALSWEDTLLINGLCSHVAEMDDGSRFGMMHPGAPIFSGLLPVAQLVGATQEQLLRAVIVGYEASLSLASALQPGIKERGYHATGVCGSVGVAVAIASLRGYSEKEFKSAISAAILTSGGLLGAIDDESELKPYNIAHAVQSGVLAAKVARVGFAGPIDALGGKRGFAAVVAGLPNFTLPTSTDSLEIERIYVKPYAACRHCHSPIAAALALKAKTEFDVAQIKQVKVRTYHWAVEGHDQVVVDSISSAKMSIPYSVAVVLLTGKAGLHEFSAELLDDAAIRELTHKVSVTSDENYSAQAPGKRIAEVELLLADGTCLIERVDLPKGEPESRMTDEELTDKFMGMTQFIGMSDSRASAIVNTVFDEVVSEAWLTDLMDLLK